MASINPVNATVEQLCLQALRAAGIVGRGQTPSAEEITDAWNSLQQLLQQWQENRWAVYHLVTLDIPSTGATTYSIGPGGDVETGTGSIRPTAVASAFLRQELNGEGNKVDYPLEILQSMQDYSSISLKGLKSFPGAVFYDPGYPLGTLYIWPIPNASIYSVHVQFTARLPVYFATLTTELSLPPMYFDALKYNLAIRLRADSQIGTFPGDQLPTLAASTLMVIRKANSPAVARLRLPKFNRLDSYNIFSDRW